MANVLYTAHAHVTGGRISGHGKTSDGELEVDIRVPKELGGEGGGTNPEELFAVGYAACFEGAPATVARRLKAEAADAVIDSQVQLDVSLPSVADAAEAVELVRQAHRVCPYSNATRGNIDVTLTANGQPVPD